MSKVSNEALLALVILGAFAVVGTLLISYSYSTSPDAQPSFTAMSVTNIVPLANLQERLAEKNMITGQAAFQMEGQSSSAPSGSTAITTGPVPYDKAEVMDGSKKVKTYDKVPLDILAKMNGGRFIDENTFKLKSGNILVGFGTDTYTIKDDSGVLETRVYGNDFRNEIYDGSGNAPLIFITYVNGEKKVVTSLSGDLSNGFAKNVKDNLLKTEITDFGNGLIETKDSVIKLSPDSWVSVTETSGGKFNGEIYVNGKTVRFTSDDPIYLANIDSVTPLQDSAGKTIGYAMPVGNNNYVYFDKNFGQTTAATLSRGGIPVPGAAVTLNNIIGTTNVVSGGSTERPTDVTLINRIFNNPTDLQDKLNAAGAFAQSTHTSDYSYSLVNVGGKYNLYDINGDLVREDVPNYIALSMSANDLKDNVGKTANEYIINGQKYIVDTATNLVAVYKKDGNAWETTASDYRIPLGSAAIDKTFVEVKTGSSGSTELIFNNQKLSVGAAIALGLVDITQGNKVVGVLNSQITDKQLAAAMKEIPADAVYTTVDGKPVLVSKGITYTITKPTDMDKSLTISSNQPLSNLFISSSVAYDDKGKPSGDGAHFVTNTPGETKGGIELSPQAYDNLKEFNGLGLIPDKLVIDAANGRIDLGNGNYFLNKKDNALYSKVPEGLRKDGVIADKDGKTFIGKDELGRITKTEQDTKGDTNWRTSVNGFTTKICINGNCEQVPYECNKNNPGCITGLIDWESLKKNGVSDSTIAAMKEQVDFETTGLRWQAAYRAALGAAKIGNMVFCGNTDCFAEWRRGVDRLFRSMFGFIMYPEESLCKKYVDRSNDAGFAFIEAPNGLIDVAAHVEGERIGPITHPAEPVTNRNAAASSGTETSAASSTIVTEYSYKFTFFVENPKYTKEGFERKEFSFNVELRGDKTRDLLEKDVVLKAGQSHSARGREAIVFYDPDLFTEVCIVFDGEVINWKNPLCNKIAG